MDDLKSFCVRHCNFYSSYQSKWHSHWSSEKHISTWKEFVKTTSNYGSEAEPEREKEIPTHQLQQEEIEKLKEFCMKHCGYGSAKTLHSKWKSHWSSYKHETIYAECKKFEKEKFKPKPDNDCIVLAGSTSKETKENQQPEESKKRKIENPTTTSPKKQKNDENFQSFTNFSESALAIWTLQHNISRNALRVLYKILKQPQFDKNELGSADRCCDGLVAMQGDYNQAPNE